jgi:hypothetical protein
MNDEREGAEPGELLAEETHVFPRRPGMDHIGRTAVGKNALPISVYLRETVDRIALVSQSSAAVAAFWKGHGRGMAEGGELIGEVVDVDSAVRAEVVVENEKDVTHAERRL